MNQILNESFVFLIGMIFGVIMENTTQILISRRSYVLEIGSAVDERLKKLFWAVINGLIWWLLARINGVNLQTVQCMFLISIGIMLSMVDIKIKKLPNELILLIILVGIEFLIMGQTTGDYRINIAGFLTGFGIFLIPAFMGRGAGSGDVKYAAAVGFCLGLYGLLSAVIIMSLIIVLYTVVLIVRKKGGLKTKIALGPFLTLGFSFVLVLNLVK